jgi:hypothetical protein
VIANADHRGVFNFSYAAGLGAAAYQGYQREELPSASRSLPRGIPTPAPSDP